MTTLDYSSALWCSWISKKILLVTLKTLCVAGEQIQVSIMQGRSPACYTISPALKS